MATITLRRAGGAEKHGPAVRHRDPSKARWWVVLAFMSPFLAGLVLFVIYPVCATLYYSFTNFQAGSYLPVRWVGFRNYTTLFTGSDTFWVAVRNTLWMVVNIGGHWYTSGGVEYWYGLGQQGGPPSQFAANH